jgi:hypothetical protein
MKARIALVGAFAAAIAALAVPTPAHAGPNNNDAASVAGVSSLPASEGCPPGNFCIYTGPHYTGRVYRLYNCRNYSLANWNGGGSWLNHNTGGALAYIKDQNGRKLVTSDPDRKKNTWYGYEYNFKPAWFVQAC